MAKTQSSNNRLIKVFKTVRLQLSSAFKFKLAEIVFAEAVIIIPQTGISPHDLDFVLALSFFGLLSQFQNYLACPTQAATWTDITGLLVDKSQNFGSFGSKDHLKELDIDPVLSESGADIEHYIQRLDI